MTQFDRSQPGTLAHDMPAYTDAREHYEHMSAASRIAWSLYEQAVKSDSDDRMLKLRAALAADERVAEAMREVHRTANE